MNERSSRSHSVFRLTLTGTNALTKEVATGVLNLVDLAGKRSRACAAVCERACESAGESVCALGLVCCRVCCSVCCSVCSAVCEFLGMSACAHVGL